MLAKVMWHLLAEEMDDMLTKLLSSEMTKSAFYWAGLEKPQPGSESES
jgi:hypothetical protein